MFMDKNLVLSTAQSIASAAGDVVSTNIYDTGAAQDVGIGFEMELVVALTAAVTSGGAATVQVVLQTDTATNFATSLTEFPLTGALALAALTTGAELYKGRLPTGMKRYFRVVYRVAVATTTAGSANAFVVIDAQAQQYLPKGFTV